MSLQNRVNPEGVICFSESRGTLMGNRGCLHDHQKQIVASSKRDAWVSCALDFKSIRRQLMNPGSYTELFFLDEATAFAAGHRPCATCRRDRYVAFMSAWGMGNCNGARVLATEVDKLMKRDRLPTARKNVATLEGIPNGVMVKTADGTCHLVMNGCLLPWSFQGYGKPLAIDSFEGPFLLLTPQSTVNAIRSGYEVGLHASCQAS